MPRGPGGKGHEIYEELHAAGKVRLDDDYFLELTSFNSEYTRTTPLTSKAGMGSRELGVYRIGFMLLNYAISYLLFYPARIWRAIKNVFLGGNGAATGFEYRLKDVLRGKIRPAT